MNETCDFLITKCDCSYQFGREQQTLECPHCGKERTRCKKVRPFIWVTDPETGKKANTGERHKHCYFHGQKRDPEVGATANRTKDIVDYQTVKHNGKSDEEIKQKFIDKYVEQDKFVKTNTGFVPKLPQGSEFFDVWKEHVDNQDMTNLRGEVALLRAYLQYNIQEHGDYPEAKDVRLSQRLIQQTTSTITNIMELETKLSSLVSVSEVRAMVERIIAVILRADISDDSKFKLAEEIKIATNQE
tara:strand:+ start:205 stop:936 length:732 start_codon:yes stop_codon:yes gene_type:complete